MLTIKNESGVITELPVSDLSQFRMVLLNGNGSPEFIGDLTLPKKNIRAPLRLWAEEWAANQDLAELRRWLITLRDAAVNWVAGQGVTRSEAYSKKLAELTASDFLYILEGVAPQISTLATEQYGKNDGNLVSLLTVELLRSSLLRLKREGQIPNIVWEVEFLPKGSDVYRILLEGIR